ncbi:MAG TPA: aldo/keto reductase [Planctomycetota bacterium]|nr:aldo/keto reductase [Planctomycetota bacterium]
MARNQAIGSTAVPVARGEGLGSDLPPLPTRALGRTGRQVGLFGLGGEGILRTQGRQAEATAMIRRAVDQGVNYFDTAPAYASSMDYLGAAFREILGAGWGQPGRRFAAPTGPGGVSAGRMCGRTDMFLASKTADRTRAGSLKILDNTLQRLGTDYLDLWQLHDLRTIEDLDRIFAKGGAIEALTTARADGRVKHLGLTGHHDPAVLLEGLRRFPFDTLLVALNAGDVHVHSFVREVLPLAMQQGLGVIGMKCCAQGRLLDPGLLSMDEALGYVLSLTGVSLTIIGCMTPAHVDDNARIVRAFRPIPAAQRQALEARTKAKQAEITYYKKGH